MSEPIKEIRKYFSTAKIEHLIDENAMVDAERFLNEPVQLSMTVARCTCGWFDYYSSSGESPSTCPRCSADLVIRNSADTEVVYPVVTPN